MNMNNLYKKRIKILYFICLLLFSSLGYRLYNIQIVNENKYSELALNQRSKDISLNPPRGTIFDRNNKELTNLSSELNIILPRKVLDNDENLYDDIKSNTSLSISQLEEALKSMNYLVQIPLKSKFPLDKKYLNVFFVDMVKRYKDDNLLSHVIGYVNKSDNSGAYGIEKVYDEFLKIKSDKSLMVEYDRSRSIILGGEEYANEATDPNNPSGVKLTIDFEIQKIVEDIMDENSMNGSIVVADVEDATVLAMASRPYFQQDNVEKYLNNKDMALYNKAIQVGYPPGSIFKIVTLLAAMEEDLNIDLMNHTFNCPGYAEIGDTRINCSGVHNDITLQKGFEVSCNTVFIEIGKIIGAKSIIEKAEELNFGQKINIGMLEEVAGNLPKGNELLGPAIGNISIGQGTLEVTPLQITNLMLTIANDGIQKHMSIIEGITNKNGDILKKFNKDPDKVVISNENANLLKSLLIDVVKNGSGKNMNLAHIGGAGGKTGTAQAMYIGESTVHGWFTGFFPEEDPKYIITVFIEDAISGSRSATPIFEKICKKVNKLY